MDELTLAKEQILNKMRLTDVDKNMLYHNLINILKSNPVPEQAAVVLVRAINDFIKDRILTTEEMLDSSSITNNVKDGRPRFRRAAT